MLAFWKISWARAKFKKKNECLENFFGHWEKTAQKNSTKYLLQMKETNKDLKLYNFENLNFYLFILVCYSFTFF